MLAPSATAKEGGTLDPVRKDLFDRLIAFAGSVILTGRVGQASEHTSWILSNNNDRGFSVE